MSSAAGPRTALVHDWLTGMRGGEKVLEALAGHFPDAPLFTLFHFPGTMSRLLEQRRIVTSFLQRAPALRRRYRYYLPLFPSAVESLDLTPFDLVISSSHCVAKGVIPAPNAFHLCYCHTPMRYAWDQESAYFPRRRGPIARLRGLSLSRLRSWDAASAPRVDLFVANSSFVKERIRRYYARDAEVLPPPVDTDFYTPGDEANDDRRQYLLSVAALSPYKRHDLAIAAAKQLGLQLRIVGDGPDRKRLLRLAGPETRLLGRVEGEALRELYRGALAFVQPAIEDFGIAAVEALACGTPVVAAGRGGVTDIVGDGAHGVLYSATEEPRDLAAAIDKCRGLGFNLLNLRQRAEEFSSQRFAQRFSSLLERRLPDDLRRWLAGRGSVGCSFEGPAT